MKVKLIFIGDFSGRREVELNVDGKKKYSEILESLGINPETVVLVRNGTPVPTEDFAEEGEVRVIRVISGG